MKNNYFYDNVKIHGEIIRSKARYNKCTKEEALENNWEYKEWKIKELTFSFD